nr:uncharacterized protein LOC128678900 [Plodia interpunctella]
MREYKRKTERATQSQDVYELAAAAVAENECSLRQASKDFGLCHVSLYRYIKKKKNNENPKVGYVSCRQVFSGEEECKLSSYILKCAEIYFGLLPTEIRKLAYQCAVHLNAKNTPSSWKKNNSAGPDWFQNFMRRNPHLSLRTPEATSMSRATSFNKTNVASFFEVYKRLLEKNQFSASRIWNIDETGVTTVQKPKKIVAARGQKQVGAITSAERGTLVTLACAANAAGNFIPPMFIFPRLKYSEMFIRGGPPDCIGAGNSSGWMTEKEFLVFMDHFIKHAKPTKEEPVLLLLDNHCSHVNIAIVEKAKENNVVMLSFPPHCSHNLQPMDVGVYGPFKNYVNRAQTAWMHNNPGKTMTIYDIPGIVKESLPLALNPANIMSGFKASGVWPLNVDIFQDSDFAPSFVTDRPAPTEQSENAINVSENLSLNLEHPELLDSVPELDISTSEIIRHIETANQPTPSCSGLNQFSPTKIRPLPKAPPRKTNMNTRRKRKSAVLTDTPEKEALRMEYEEKMKKKQKKDDKGKEKGKGKQKGKSKGKKSAKNKDEIERVKKRVLSSGSSDSDSESEEWYCLVCSEEYSQSKGNWVQCTVCKMWAHVGCVGGNTFSFVCINCNSDDD